MPDRLPTNEVPTSPPLIVGETPVYLNAPQHIGDQEISTLTIQSADKRGPSGVGSTVLLVREPSRRKGEEGQLVDKPMMNVDPMDAVAWEKISGLQWTDDAGVTHVIPKEALTLVAPPEAAVPPPTTLPEQPVSEVPPAPSEQVPAEPIPEAPQAAAAPTQTPGEATSTEAVSPEGPLPAAEPGAEVPLPENATPESAAPEAVPPTIQKVEPAKARQVLSSLQEDPNTVTIVGLRAYETRALDLADRTMQRLGTPKQIERAEAVKNLWDKTKDALESVRHFFVDSIWKQSIGGIYFHEKSRQYYLDMLTAAETPFAEQSIRLAEARATERYNQKMRDSNFLVRIGSNAVESLRSGFGMHTAVQDMALEEIAVMKQNGELSGTEVFEREAKAVRTRFAQDFDKADQFVRTQLGEKLEILDASKPEHRPLVEGIHNLLRDYAGGAIQDKAEFDKRAKEFFKATLSNVRPDIFAEAELYSSSLFETAEMLRNKMSHEAGLANIDEAMAGLQIRLGLGQMGEVTSLEPTAVERGIGRVREVYEWLNKQNIIVPMVFNEATVGAGVAIALSAVKFLQTTPFRLLGGPIGAITGGSLAGGAFAGWREYGQLQRDYLTHLREREVGTQFTETQRRRAWFEHLSVKQRSANEMMSTIQSSLYDADGALKPALTDDELRNAFATVADLQARKAVSEVGPKRIGLVQYSSREGLESERAALDVVASKALTDMESYMETHPDQAQTVLGGMNFSDFMVALSTNQTKVLKEGVGVMESFDDPVKATLGVAAVYAPEVDIIKRRFPYITRGTTSEEKVEGMDAILAEFKRESRNEAIKYGVRAGIIGAAIGTVLHAGELFNKVRVEAPAAQHVPSPAEQTAGVTGHATIGTTPPTIGPGTPQGLPQSPFPQGPPSGVVPLPQGPESGTLPPETLPKLTNDFTISGHDLAGKGGLWDYFLGKFHGENSVSATNGMKNLFRIYEQQNGTDNIHFGVQNADHTWTNAYHHAIHFRDADLGGKMVQNDIDLNRLANDTNISLPSDVFGPKGVEWFQTNNDTAIHVLQDAVKSGHLNILDANGKVIAEQTVHGPGEVATALYQSGNADQKVQGILLRLGYIGNDGQLPTDPKDLSLLFDKMGAHISTGQHIDNLGQSVGQKTGENITQNVSNLARNVIDKGEKDSLVPPHVNADYTDAALRHAPVVSPTYSDQAVRAAAAQTAALHHDNYVDAALRHAPAPDYTDAAGRHATDATAATVAATHEFPWFPVIVPIHNALELAPTEVAATTEPQPTKPHELPYSPFGLEAAALTPEMIAARKSPRLTENPGAQLHQHDEIAWYLNQLSQEEAVTLSELVGQTTIPIDPMVRSVVIMPPSGLPISTYDRLSRYVGQTNPDGTPIDAKQVEYVVYDAKLAGQPDSTVKTEVDRFMSEHPDFRVVYLTHTYPEPVAPGQIKRDLTNVTLSRIGTLPTDNPDVLIVSDSAGSTIPTTYLASSVTAFDADPTTDMVAGETVLHPEAYKQFPMLFAQHRAFELFDAMVRHGEDNGLPGVMSGNNAVRSATLSAVGGYNSAAPIAEDRELASIIRTARGDNTDVIKTLPELTATIDPSDTSYRMLQHVGIADAGLARAQNETYKAVSWQDMAQKATDAYTKEMFETDLTNMYDQLYPKLRAENPQRFDAYFKRTMDTLGIQYEMTDGKIHVSDTSGLAANMATDIDMDSLAKQAAAEVVAATPKAPETPREALEQVAGPATEASSQPQATETTAPSVSSPDVSSVSNVSSLPEQAVQKESPKVTEILPEDLQERVNYVLSKTKESDAAVDITTQELLHYLKSHLEMAGNTRITGGTIQIEGNKVKLSDMTARSFVGNVHFTGQMVPDPNKGLIIDMNSVHYDLPLLMKLFEGRIKNQLGHFDQTFLHHMSQRLPPDWKAQRLDIVGEKLEVKFAKTTT